MKKQKLLIYAHYYIPDVASTGQIIRELAEGMQDTFDITVICVVPSYSGKIDSAFQTKKYYREEINGIHVIRVSVPPFSKSNKVSRIKNILTYFIRAIHATKLVDHQDYVFSISQPPILGGLLGVWGKKYHHARFIYNIQDFNPEQTMAVGYSKNTYILKLMMALDKFSCRQSDVVITVGRDLVKTLKSRFKPKSVPNVVMINNWVDEKKIRPLPVNDAKVLAFKKKYALNDKFIVMYSGNIGLYYDLENLIKVIERFPEHTCAVDGREVVFAFVGGGSMLQSLKDYVEKHQMKNVSFIPYQPKDELIYSLNAADIHWCVSAKGIKGVSCPSKFYGIAAVGKPVLAVLERGTEIESLIKESQGGYLAEPGDYSKIAENLKKVLAVPQQMGAMGTRNRVMLDEKGLTKEASILRYKSTIQNI